MWEPYPWTCSALSVAGVRPVTGLVAGWIAQTQTERSAAEARMARACTHTSLCRDEVAALVRGFADYLALIRNAKIGGGGPRSRDIGV